MKNTFLSLLCAVLASTSSPLLAHSSSPCEQPPRQHTAHTAPQLGFFEKIALRAALRKFNKTLKKKRLAVAALGDSIRPCGYVVLYPGERVEAELLEISALQVTYRPCGKADATPVVRLKREVLVVVAPNGDELFSNISGPWGSGYGRYAGEQDGSKLDGLAMLSLIFGLIPTAITPLAAIIIGAISLSRIKRHPERYKGKSLAIGGIVLGVLAILIALLVLLS